MGYELGPIVPMNEELATQVRWLVDRAQISELLHAFAAALDTRDWRGYADLYADDGYIELPDPKSGSGANITLHKSQMPELVPKSLGRYSATHHISANHQIEIQGDEAASRSYLQAVHVRGEPTDHWTAGGWYDCRYRRIDGCWRFTQVKLSAIWLDGKVGAIDPHS